MKEWRNIISEMGEEGEDFHKDDDDGGGERAKWRHYQFLEEM